jgi:hypothetical protein
LNAIKKKEEILCPVSGFSGFNPALMEAHPKNFLRSHLMIEANDLMDVEKIFGLFSKNNYPTQEFEYYPIADMISCQL